MSGSRFGRLVRVATAVAATAAAGGRASQDVTSQWYADLDKPAFQPPGEVFGVVWTVLYADIVLAGGHALDQLERTGRPEEAAAYRKALGLNLAVNAAWSWVFFRQHRLGSAVLVAGGLGLSSADLVRRTSRVSRAAGVALSPYPLWCGFATLLSAEIWRRNR